MRARHSFVVLVLGAVLLGFLAERRRMEDTTARFEFSPLVAPPFEPLAVPLGEQALRGVVVLEDGTPAIDVQVFLYRVEPVPGAAEPLAWTQSDAEGRFELEHLVTARYEAALVRSGHPPVTYAIDVPSQGEVHWTIPPRLEPLPVLPEIERAPLAGRVAPPAGLGPWPIAGYQVVLRPTPDTPPLCGAVTRRVAVDEAGAFRLENLVRARYLVEVLPPWAAGGSWPALTSVEFDHTRPDSPELELALASGAIAGAIVDQLGRALEGALVMVSPASEPDRIWPARQTDDAGAFEVRDLPPGRYVLRLRAGLAAREQELDVRAGEVAEVVFEPLDLEEGLEERSP